MNNLELFLKKYNITDIDVPMPIVVPEVGRVELADLIRELGFKVGAEIGVQRGEYSEVLCKLIPGVKLYCIDSWQHYDGYIDFRHREDSEPKAQRVFDRFYERAKQVLAPYDCELIKDWSTEAVKRFEDESLDFVYIDGNHDFEHTTSDIAEWSKKVKKGGIIAGHDFWRANTANITIHVEDVVRGWTAAHEIKPWFAITKDRCPNWFWIKQ